MPHTHTPAPVLDFWLGDGLSHWPAPQTVDATRPPALIPGWPSQDMSERWFGGSQALDQEIERKFGAAVTVALAGGLTKWEREPLERLALVILLDQFPRNIYRGKSRAFAGDERAQKLVNDALAQSMDEALPWVARMFLYMPLMHAEDLAMQEESVRRFSRLAAAAPAELQDTLNGSLRFAEQHRDIIARLGRFPHRNNALGRTNTALEFEFLKNGPRFGQ